METATIRAYEAGRFSSIPLPDWFKEAITICSTEQLRWHESITQTLKVDHKGLAVESTGPIASTSASGDPAMASTSRSRPTLDL